MTENGSAVLILSAEISGHSHYNVNRGIQSLSDLILQYGGLRNKWERREKKDKERFKRLI